MHANTAIRSIACHLAGEAATDRQIMLTARRLGCLCPVLDDLDRLAAIDRFRLLKFLLNQGREAGCSIRDMARL